MAIVNAMESLEQANYLVYIIITIGGLILGMMVFLCVSSWKLGRGLLARDNRMSNLENAFHAHEDGCDKRQEKNEKEFENIKGRLNDAQKHFETIEHSLGRIEGKIGD